MASSTLAKELQSAVDAALSVAMQLPTAELIALGEAGRTVKVGVLGKSYELNTWSEPVPGDHSGAFAVLVSAWSRSFLGFSKHYFNGFTVTVDGTRINIPETDLWQYD